jgi:hypothetical protein
MPLITGLAALAAKVASASTVAQVSAGLGIAVAGVTGAGFTGVLPDPVQDGVASVVEGVTPLDLPGSSDSSDAPRPHSVADDRAETDDSGVDDPGDLDDSDEDSPATSTPPAVPSATSGPDDHGDHGDRVDGTHAPRTTPAGTPAPRTGNSGPGSVPGGSGSNSGPGGSGSGRDHAEDDRTAGPTAGPTPATPSDDTDDTDDTDDDSGHHSGSGHDDDGDSSGHGSDHD